MTTLVANTFNWFGFNKLAKRLIEIRNEMRRLKEVRNTISELSKLSDKELNDIGLSRGDIYWVANEAYFDNQTTTNKNLRGWV